MLKKQEEFIGEFKKLKEVFVKAGLSTEKIESMLSLLGAQELLVPVVGEFSAGKSTLLNSFIGREKQILPTSVAPETAIATELRFGTDERIEAIDKNGNVAKRFSVDDFASLNSQSGDFSFVRVYLNNSNIRSIEPLVLVDMPGFESPLDAHNTAIRNYLNRGAFFVVLVSALDGTLKSTSMRHLNDILEYERDFAVVVSKSNLIEQSNLKSVCEKIENDIDENFMLKKTPVAIGLDGSKAMGDIVRALDPDSLFETIVSPAIKDCLYQLSSSVNVKSAAFSKSSDENNSAIDNLKHALEKIKRERDRLLSESRKNLVDNNVPVVVNGVGKDLSSAVESLVEIGVKGSADAMNSEIQDIIHSSLIQHVKTAVTNMRESIMSRFSVELSNLKEWESYCGDVSFATKISENSALVVDNRKPIAEFGGEVGNAVANVAYKVLTGILAITTSILNPILEVLVIFLPELIRHFFKKKAEERERAKRAEQEEQMRDELRQALLGDVIPAIKRELSSNIPGILEENIRSLIDEIGKRYEDVIDEKQFEIEQAEKRRAEHSASLDAERTAIVTAKSEIEILMRKIFS